MELVTCPACKGQKQHCVLCGGKGEVTQLLAEIYDKQKYQEELYVGELIADNAEWKREFLANS